MQEETDRSKQAIIIELIIFIIIAGQRDGSLAGPWTFEFQTELIPGQVEPVVLCLIGFH